MHHHSARSQAAAALPPASVPGLTPGAGPDAVAVEAFEVVSSLPASSGDAARDCYEDHRRVWSLVDPSGRAGGQARFLFRREADRIRVRAAQPLPGAARICLHLAHGELIQVEAVVALWRSPKELRGGDPLARASQLLRGAGLEPESMRIGRVSLANGCKSRGGHHICLPAAHLGARARVADARLVGEAWLGGIGRGRRFGFGMLDITTPSLSRQ